MKLVLILSIILLFNNCSLNKDSKYLTEDGVNKVGEQKKLSNVAVDAVFDSISIATTSKKN